MSKHTPGELEVGIIDPQLDAVEWFRETWGKRAEEERETFIVFSRDTPFEGETYLFTAVCGNGPASESNAYLYAAAPDLLHNLKDAICSCTGIASWTEAVKENLEYEECPYHEWAKAIAKAEGWTK